MNLLLNLLTQDLPPAIVPLVKLLEGMIPNQAWAQLDEALEIIIADLANGRDTLACDKLRQLLIGLGVKLDDYRDQP